MTIDDLKRALVEVMELCNREICINCPFHTKDEACKECRTYNEGFKLRGVCPENTKEEPHEATPDS